MNYYSAGQQAAKGLGRLRGCNCRYCGLPKRGISETSFSLSSSSSSSFFFFFLFRWLLLYDKKEVNSTWLLPGHCFLPSVYIFLDAHFPSRSCSRFQSPCGTLHSHIYSFIYATGSYPFSYTYPRLFIRADAARVCQLIA